MLEITTSVFESVKCLSIVKEKILLKSTCPTIFCNLARMCLHCFPKRWSSELDMFCPNVFILNTKSYVEIRMISIWYGFIVYIKHYIWMTNCCINVIVVFFYFYVVFWGYKWRFIWSDKWSLLENALGQCWHWNGLAPVCFLIWRVSSSERANLQVHPSQEQWYGFSPRIKKIRVDKCLVLSY